MIFNELSYFVFFLLPAVIAFHLVSPRFRAWVISGFGVAFFVYFGYLHFGGLWGALCVLIFGWEIVTSRLYRPGSRWCLFGIVQAIAFLFLFKYLVFATSSWNDLAAVLHLPRLGSVSRWLLPLGISFFTFEFIHFAADTYQGKIERASISRIRRVHLVLPVDGGGAHQALSGLRPEAAKRAVRSGARRLRASPGSSPASPRSTSSRTRSRSGRARLNGPQLYGGALVSDRGMDLAYGMQIYFDFSGYSDIAIGSGYLFGITIPENFNWPYLSRNITEFWRRWHISLSSWIRDYVYIPLGGSQLRRRPNRAQSHVAFTISGIWHGAAYNFVAVGRLARHACWSGIACGASGCRRWPRGSRRGSRSRSPSCW